MGLDLSVHVCSRITQRVTSGIEFVFQESEIKVTKTNRVSTERAQLDQPCSESVGQLPRSVLSIV